MKPWLSIIVPTFNRQYSLTKFLFPSLEKQDLKGVEVVLVDDASTDTTAEYLASKEFKTNFPKVSAVLNYQCNTKNLGAPGSRNRGVAAARADWVWIVEDDIEIPSVDFLKVAQQILSNCDQDIVVVSPKRAEGKAHIYYKNPKRSFARIGLLSGEVYLDPTQEYTGEVPNTHASSFVRTTAYRAVGEDEVNFFGNTFRDESDLYMGIRANGGRILYCADQLRALHRNDVVTTGGQKKVDSLGLLRQEGMVWRNHYRYLRKHYSLAELRVLCFMLVRFVNVISTRAKVPILKNILAWCKF